MNELWWQKAKREEREALEKTLSLRNDVREICGQAFYRKVSEDRDLPDGQLPDGICVGKHGVFLAQCVCCEEWTEIYCDLDEFDVESHYCGGSPRCCP